MLLLPPVDQHSLVENMIVKFLKVAIQRVALDTPEFYSYLFFAQKKKNREWRLIFNLKIKTLESVRNLLQIGEWVTYINLKDD